MLYERWLIDTKTYRLCCFWLLPMQSAVQFFKLDVPCVPIQSFKKFMWDSVVGLVPVMWHLEAWLKGFYCLIDLCM